MLNFIFQVILNGLLLGCLYALLGSGINLMFGATNYLYLAYGESIMIAMYAFYFLSTFGIDIIWSLPIVIVVTLLLSIIIFYIIRHLIRAEVTTQLVATAGFSMLLQNMALLLWGPDFRGVRAFLGSFELYGVSISYTRLLAAVVSIIILLCLHIFQIKTLTGKAIKAVADDREAAKLMGIDLNRVYLITFLLANILGTIVAFFLVLMQSIHPYVGSSLLTIAFMVMSIGGLGNWKGSILGGLIIGLVETIIGSITMPAIGIAFSYALFVIIILLRPKGLLGV